MNPEWCLLSCSGRNEARSQLLWVGKVREWLPWGGQAVSYTWPPGRGCVAPLGGEDGALHPGEAVFLPPVLSPYVHALQM